ncbi:MAG: hypothetical protein K0R54_232 [Clostridiaceae bacterium]|nr:hypothetical protein [Clostridiaceae bacterium]
MIDISGLKIDFKNRENWVAIIGSRNASDKEKEIAYKLGRKCAKEGKIVVSGLALGIDSFGHLGCIDGGGKTIALVHTPISVPIYPKENHELAEKIRKNGCIIHPFKTKAKFEKNGMSQSSKRLIERSILNAYVCPNIVVVKESPSIITGGTKWATKYGTDISHNVFRLDSDFKFHKNPVVEDCKTWWIRELNLDIFLKELGN